VSIASLREVGTGAHIDIVIMTDEGMDIPKYITIMQKIYNFRLVEVAHLRPPPKSYSNYLTVMGKLRVFQLYEYARVVFLDADTLVQRNLDHLFDLTAAAFAAPRAYWLKQPFISSQLFVLTPSPATWARIDKYFAPDSDLLTRDLYDMDLLNLEFKDDMTILPSIYCILNGHFDPNQKSNFEKWKTIAGGYEVNELIDEAFVVHFSDTKPWKYNGRKTASNDHSKATTFYNTLYKDWKSMSSTLCHNP
jgi:alpha-N-acetylglucosamine transferase